MNRELLLKALSFLTSIGLAVASYFLTDTYKKMDDMRTDITELKIHKERAEASQFTAADFNRAKENIDAQIIATDRRVLILEESHKSIKELLVEIRGDLKDLKNSNYSLK